MRSALPLFLLLLAPRVTYAVNDDGLDTSDVTPLVRFLEHEPFSKDAPLARKLLVRWEEKNSEVVDVLVCPDLLQPLPDKKIQFNAELIAQYMFGIMSYQLAHPTHRRDDDVFPAQIAGIRSALRAYDSIVQKKPKARILAYDRLLKLEKSNALEGYFRPLVKAKCGWQNT
jgi:hypothetical protein